MTLKINQHRGASLPRPRRRHQLQHRQHQAGQQHIVDAAMKRRRHARQQCLRHRSRQRSASDGRPCPLMSRPRSSAPSTSDNSRRAQHPAPERKLRYPRCDPAPQRQAAAPSDATTSRAAPAPACRPPQRPPRRRKIRHQDAPRHPVNREVMDHQQQPSGSLRPSIKPHRLHHHARTQATSRAPAACACFRDAGAATRPHQARKHRYVARRQSPPSPLQPARSPAATSLSSCAAATSRSRSAS